MKAKNGIKSTKKDFDGSTDYSRGFCRIYTIEEIKKRSEDFWKFVLNKK